MAGSHIGKTYLLLGIRKLTKLRHTSTLSETICERKKSSFPATTCWTGQRSEFWLLKRKRRRTTPDAAPCVSLLSDTSRGDVSAYNRLSLGLLGGATPSGRQVTTPQEENDGSGFLRTRARKIAAEKRLVVVVRSWAPRKGKEASDGTPLLPTCVPCVLPMPPTAHTRTLHQYHMCLISKENTCVQVFFCLNHNQCQTSLRTRNDVAEQTFTLPLC
jgi:hypothetical protein